MAEIIVDTITANYLHVQRLSTEDGPGIRTTVFLKGCSLHCAWCHNPESISIKPHLQWLERLCIGCQTCVLSCPNESLRMENGELRIDRIRCRTCGVCVNACPANALELLGRKITVEEMMQELMKDISFFTQSDGGVTLSGGEPALQPEFSAALFKELKEKNIHTALDTCGNVKKENLAMIVPFTDLVLYDLKIMDSQEHARFTGVGNERILENLIWLSEFLNQKYPEVKLWIRTPLIPGASATMQNIQAIADFLNKRIEHKIERWELCAFNNLCRDKYNRLNLHWDYDEQPLMRSEELLECEQWAKAVYAQPNTVFISGAARSEK